MYGFLNIKIIFLFPHFLFLFSYKHLGENTFLIFLDPSKERYYISTFDTKYKTKKTKICQKDYRNCQFFNPSIDDQVDVLTLTLKQLSIFDRSKFSRKPTRKGHSLLPRATCVAVWEFWHEHCFESTNTTQLAKLRVTDRNKIQTNLEFSSFVTIVKQRNKQFYQSIWKIAEKPYKVLYQKFLISNSNFSLSWGSFLALRPFYICHSTLKDMEICCCLLHLHARWSINAIIQCAKK